MTGQLISHYEILEKLGEGGMGIVYKARDTQLGRQVALKVLSNELMGSANSKQRFIQEARAASALNHPNIITVHEISSFEDVNFIVMELVRGKTLASLLDNKVLPLRETLRYALQMADALGAAHAAGIVHRDLKPANVMVTNDGLVKILDFGLAKLGAPDRSASDQTQTMLSSLTEPGRIVGTAPYMSPEQAEGTNVDARSDIFSLGAVLYEMVTGRRAFQAQSKLSTLAAVLRDEPRPLRETVRDAPPALEEVLLRCLRKDPNLRFQNMLELKQTIEALLMMPLQTETVPSIAVLPFANMSPEKDNEYFSDGLAEEILNALSKLPGLRVAARTSAFAFRGKD